MTVSEAQAAVASTTAALLGHLGNGGAVLAGLSFGGR